MNHYQGYEPVVDQRAVATVRPNKSWQVSRWGRDTRSNMPAVESYNTPQIRNLEERLRQLTGYWLLNNSRT